SVGGYPGWHLDDFAGVGVEAFVPSHDVGIADIVAPVDVVEDGDIVAPEVVVENYGPVMDTFDVTLMIDPSFECNGDRQVYEEVQTVIVDGETTLNLVFSDWTAVAGSYDVTAYTTLASDTFYNNDTLTEGCIVASWIEDFEDGVWPPVGWAGYELGDPAGWEQLEDDAYSGVYCAYHDYWSGSPDDWLVTSAYSVGENAHLYFYQMDNWSGDYVYHGIWVSSGSGVPDADYSELMELGAATEDVWTIYGPVNLCAYVGEQIYISFVYQGYYADEWYLDDIVGINLDPRIPYDVSVDDILIDERVDTLPQGTLLHPTAVVANNSPWGGPDLSFRVYYKIHKDGNIYWRRVYD
ncbi:choice-of-anchor J domain-containing protein, partial [candidate division WOR-3 bacterium]|nr:choice-of-anchor J domain-containing protein [candidate division WOR-3 bacterium]